MKFNRCLCVCVSIQVCASAGYTAHSSECTRCTVVDTLWRNLWRTSASASTGNARAPTNASTSPKRTMLTTLLAPHRWACSNQSSPRSTHAASQLDRSVSSERSPATRAGGGGGGSGSILCNGGGAIRTGGAVGTGSAGGSVTPVLVRESCGSRKQENESRRFIRGMTAACCACERRPRASEISVVVGSMILEFYSAKRFFLGVGRKSYSLSLISLCFDRSIGFTLPP